MGKRVYIKTWGCQMNVYDSARMVDVLAPLGFAETAQPDDADLVILNTCHIREKAAEKVYSELGRLRQHRERRAIAGQETTIAVAGCVAQAEGEEIAARAPQVDLIFGPQTFHRLPELLTRVARDRGKAPIVDTDFPAESKFDELPETFAAPRGVSAFLSVQEGCDKFCTFCVVPYTRGAEASRPADQILDEARRLIASGAQEITLLGQNVNAYHGASPDGGIWSLGRLIRALADIDGVVRLRYTTSHPLDMDDDLIDCHGSVPALMPFLHLPVQSGSDRILQAMNRRHTADDYRRIIDRLRAVRPDLALSSDFIVGFPGETDHDFAQTMDLVRTVTYAQAYSFKYSARPGTPASSLKTAVPMPEKDARLQALQGLLSEQQHAFNTQCVGTVQPVLFDRPGKRPGQVTGRSPFMQAIYAQAPTRVIGSVLPVHIDNAGPNALIGTIDGAQMSMATTAEAMV